MTTTAEITDPFLQAVEDAKNEMGEATPTESLPASPAEETEVLAPEEPEEAVGEQSETLEPPAEDEASEDAPDELFADLEVETPEEPEAPQGEQTFELPGIDEPVSLEELKNGYLRQADYTRKTQEIATQRQSADKALSFWEALTSNPKGVAAQLAVAAGLIEEGAQPVKVTDLPFKSDEDMQAEVDQKVAEALASHPDIDKAMDIIAERWLETEFSRIEQEHNVKLGPKSRDLVMRTAYDRKVDDLEMVFLSLRAKQQEQARNRDSLKQAAPARPTGQATPQAVTEDPASFIEAAMQAAAEKGIQLNLDN